MLQARFMLFPALAGVILNHAVAYFTSFAFPRTRGGDPNAITNYLNEKLLFPALAGVILNGTYKSIWQFTFPRTRGGDPSMQGR